MDQITLNKLHEAQLEIMDEIHRVCDQENLNYYLIFGSLIGAVRHNGFIPWDYDIDCGMVRDDYERFAKACKNGKISSRFVYYDSKNVTRSAHKHGIVSIRGTSLKTRSDKYNKDSFDYGIHIDIFPIDNAPDSPIEQEKHSKSLKRISHKIYIKLHTNYNSSKIIKALKWLRSLLVINRSMYSLIEELNDESCRYNKIDTRHYILNNNYNSGAIPKEWFGKPQLKQFENRQYFIPREYDRILTQGYGDYMKFPPEKDRLFSANYIECVSFDKEY